MKNTYPVVYNGNSKLGDGVLGVNMPRLLSCRQNAPCAKGCYCGKGNFAFKNVQQSHIKNLEAYNSDASRFFDVINAKLFILPAKYFRWHSSGDIPDMEYLRGMCEVARKNKGTRFLCFTKKYEIVNEYFDTHKKPANLIIVLSNWGKWRCENPHDFPESDVIFKNPQQNGDRDGEYMLCPGKCAKCGYKCWHMKKGQKVKFKQH